MNRIMVSLAVILTTLMVFDFSCSSENNADDESASDGDTDTDADADGGPLEGVFIQPYQSCVPPLPSAYMKPRVNIPAALPASAALRSQWTAS